MSADRIDVCPRCAKKYEEETAAIEQQMDASYGAVSPEEYLRLSLSLTEREPVDDACRTLIDYYEIGVSGEKFRIKFYSECHVCGFSYVYEYEERIYNGVE